MGQVIAGDISKIAGKVGDKVYVRYKGGIYVRKAPRVRKESRTPAMLLNQYRFSCITKFCVQFKNTLISMIWRDAATKGSGYNAFLKANSLAFDREGNITYPLLLKFSVGELSLPEGLIAQRLNPVTDTISVAWQKQTHLSGIRTKDDLMAICYDGEQFSAMIATGIKRKDLGGDFELPVLPLTAQYLYLFFASEDRRSFSQSRGFKIGQ